MRIAVNESSRVARSSCASMFDRLSSIFWRPSAARSPDRRGNVARVKSGRRVSFRSMEWLRRAGLAYRLRALLLLISFAIGSLLARDALLIHEAIVVQAALSENESLDGDDEPAFEERDEPVKIRP